MARKTKQDNSNFTPILPYERDQHVTNPFYFFWLVLHRHLVGLACTTWTGVSSRTGPLWRPYYTYDASRSTLTYLPHYDALWSVIGDLRLDTVPWRQGWPVGYKATLLRGMSLECSSFIVLQSDPHSPLFSTLYLLPKDQTLKQVIKQLREPPCVAEHFSLKDKQLNTKSAWLSVIPRIAQAPPDLC